MTDQSSFLLRTHTNGTWSDPVLVQPNQRIALTTETDGVDFKPVSAQGTTVGISDALVFSLAFNAPGQVDATMTEAKSVGVYRFFDTTNGTHFFTADQAEKDATIANRPDLSKASA